MTEKTQEEYEKEVQERKEEYEAYIKDLEDNPDEPITKGDLLKFVNYVSEDVGGIAQMCSINMNNNQALNHNFQQIVNVLQGGGQPPVGGQRTNGGIILP